MSREWEQYQDRFNQRPETYNAYVDVWTKNPSARMHFGSWSMFTMCASVEPRLAREVPHKVKRAEELLKAGGYKLGTPTARGARRWIRAT